MKIIILLISFLSLSSCSDGLVDSINLNWENEDRFLRKTIKLGEKLKLSDKELETFLEKVALTKEIVLFKHRLRDLGFSSPEKGFTQYHVDELRRQVRKKNSDRDLARFSNAIANDESRKVISEVIGIDLIWISENISLNTGTFTNPSNHPLKHSKIDKYSIF